jgi:PqqA peptide cyclase
MGAEDHVPPAVSQLVPRLRPGVRVAYDNVRGQMVLMHPEGVTLLNATAGAILALIGGDTTLGSIYAELRNRFDGVNEQDVLALLSHLQDHRRLELTTACPSAPALIRQRRLGMSQEPASRKLGASVAAADADADVPRPLGMLAELTHRCPLHCPYCSNPTTLTSAGAELSTMAWQDVFTQARQLGVLQLHLSGGEPLMRRDLVILAAKARETGLYVNLVTSGVGLSHAKARTLADAGVDHVQLSLQGSASEAADRIAGARVHQLKLAAATAVRAAGMVLTINVVLHTRNINDIEAVASLAAELGADRLELAHAQYYGWALRNRDALLPDAGQVQQAEQLVRAARARFPLMTIIYVTSDYHEQTPKPCMHGWGSRQLTVTPDGTVLPCPAASVIRGLDPPNIRDAPLARIWAEAPAFTRFRGTAWLPAPCRDCPAKTVDFGGCRCQAYQLLGDAAATDPVCQYSPHRSLVTAAVATALAKPRRDMVYRTGPRGSSERREGNNGLADPGF